LIYYVTITAIEPNKQIFSKQKCRAQITEIRPNTGTATVLYVDYGNEASLPLAVLRYLTDQFFVHEVAVFDGCLFGIKFYGLQELLGEQGAEEDN